ncbi:hypothetical protein CAEBREN_11690 [Caenorhabditis brenneri]|uniref:T20D4.11-like domain-containing protein n=1 Tax=Caenorhabditis brenneri TaxID=135651 RepID=G0PBM9_CAEBE|nr:hypothetical protein CAEBREN_11690 [Caenorhabditis brenneri]
MTSSSIPFSFLLFFAFLFASSTGTRSQNDAINECQNKMLEFFKSDEQLKSRHLPPNVLNSEERQLLQQCDSVSDCFENLNVTFSSSRDVRGLVGVVRLLLKPKCDMLRFNSGKFLQCAEKMNLETENMKQRVAEPGDESSGCKLTEKEFLNLFNLVMYECGEGAARDMKINEAMVKNILCIKNT